MAHLATGVAGQCIRTVPGIGITTPPQPIQPAEYYRPTTPRLPGPKPSAREYPSHYQTDCYTASATDSAATAATTTLQLVLAQPRTDYTCRGHGQSKLCKVLRHMNIRCVDMFCQSICFANARNLLRRNVNQHMTSHTPITFSDNNIHSRAQSESVSGATTLGGVGHHRGKVRASCRLSRQHRFGVKTVAPPPAKRIYTPGGYPIARGQSRLFHTRGLELSAAANLLLRNTFHARALRLKCNVQQAISLLDNRGRA